MYNVDLDEVLLYNNLFADDTISIDDEIYLPGAKPIKEIAKTIRHFKKHDNQNIYPVFHTDATQAILVIRARI